MRERMLDTVLIAGTATNICCESTARDAMMLNFKTIMVTDGNAAANEAVTLRYSVLPTVDSERL